MMSLHEELTTAQRCLDDLARTISRLEQRPALDGGLEIRRVRTDTEHLRESLALLRDCTPEGSAAEPELELEVIRVPEQPYDRALWKDADEEGLGSADRHAP